VGKGHQINSQDSNSIANATTGEGRNVAYLDGRGIRKPEQQASNACQQQSKGSAALNAKPFFSSPSKP